MQINEHPNASCSNTKNRLQIKRSSKQLTHANIGVLLNLDEHFLNLYLNGKIQWILIYLGCGGRGRVGGRGKVGRGVSSRVMYLIWCVCIRNFLEQEPMKMHFLKFPYTHLRVFLKALFSKLLCTILFFSLLILDPNCTPCIGSFNFSVYSHRPEITKFKYFPAI